MSPNLTDAHTYHCVGGSISLIHIQLRRGSSKRFQSDAAPIDCLREIFIFHLYIIQCRHQYNASSLRGCLTFQSDKSRPISLHSDYRLSHSCACPPIPINPFHIPSSYRIESIGQSSISSPHVNGIFVLLCQFLC